MHKKNILKELQIFRFFSCQISCTGTAGTKIQILVSCSAHPLHNTCISCWTVDPIYSYFSQTSSCFVSSFLWYNFHGLPCFTFLLFWALGGHIHCSLCLLCELECLLVPTVNMQVLRMTSTIKYSD